MKNLIVKSASLPLIDLTAFRHGSQGQRDEIAKLTIRTCETAGFFYLKGHGIPERLFEQARNSALAFFHLPSEEKARVHITQFKHHRGYVGHYDVAPDPGQGEIFEKPTR